MGGAGGDGADGDASKPAFKIGGASGAAARERGDAQ